MFRCISCLNKHIFNVMQSSSEGTKFCYGKIMKPSGHYIESGNSLWIVTDFVGFCFVLVFSLFVLVCGALGFGPT